MDTIPLAKKELNSAPKTAKKRSSLRNRQKVRAGSSKERVASTLNQKRRFSIWWVVLLVGVVAIVGLLVLRFSRASEVDTSGFTSEQIQSYVNEQLTTQNQSTINQTYTVSGYVPFEFTNASSEVSYVNYYLDGVPIYRAAPSPFRFDWDSSRVANGLHTMSAVAFASNNQPISATKRTLNVDNSGGAGGILRNVITYPWHWLFQL